MVIKRTDFRILRKPSWAGAALVAFLGLTCGITQSSQAWSDDRVVPIQEQFEPQGLAFPKAKWVKVAAVSYNPQIPAPLDVPQARVDAYKQNVRNELAQRITEAARKGAEVVITPEFGLVGYPDVPELPNEDDNFRNRRDIMLYAEPITGPSVSFFGNLARQLKIHLVIGFAELEGDKVFNAAVMLAPTGKVIAKYHKIHLYQNEHDFLEEGTQPVVVDTDVFGRAAFLICSDVYSSFPASGYLNLQPDVTFLSTSWAQYNSGWSSFTAYARRNRQYLVAANQNYFPDTGVINPDGSAQSHIRQTPGIAYGYIPRKSSLSRAGTSPATPRPQVR